MPFSELSEILRLERYLATRSGELGFGTSASDGGERQNDRRKQGLGEIPVAVQ